MRPIGSARGSDGRWLWRGGTLLLVLVCLAACAVAVPGTARSVPGTLTADLTSTVVSVLDRYWKSVFPTEFGTSWRPIRVLAPLRSRDDAPCLDERSRTSVQAYYCPREDALGWDAERFVPGLVERYGAVGVTVVLAHEFGHAVQARIGVEDAHRSDPGRYPPILLELMADCFAGSALRYVFDGHSPHLAVSWADRDTALEVLTRFRDPLGVVADDPAAHGNAFDRVSAFQDGVADGPTRCAEMTVDNRRFTQRAFASASDRARLGNLPLGDLISAFSRDAGRWFAGLAAARGTTGWSPPAPTAGSAGCRAQELARQGPARYCAEDGTVTVSVERLTDVHQETGDYATATLLAARYGLALLAALGRPVDGPVASRAAVCLAGAYTGRLLDATAGFGLSPGDLDEAVQVVLAYDWVARDGSGAVDETEQGYERLRHFTTGVHEGPSSCLGR